MLAVSGLAVWRSSELLAAAGRLTGAQRRFTGSRNAGGFNGNSFPANSWLLDNPEEVDTSRWRLAVVGAVQHPLKFSFDDLEASQTLRATLDCTGGWYTVQDWAGLPLKDVLDWAGIDGATRSIIVRSRTGYWRRFALEDAATLLLAVRVGDEPLAHEHGAPVRLVAPGRRGYDWVKWVSAIELSHLPPWFKWPLPLS